MYCQQRGFPVLLLRTVCTKSISWSTYRRSEIKIQFTSFSSFLTWKIFIIFQVVVVGRFHSFTTSLPVRHLETRGVGALNMKGMECSWENLNLIPMRDLFGRCLSFIIPLKDATLNRAGSITSYCSRKDPVGTSGLDSRNREISRNQAWKQKLSVSFNYYYFECTLNDTLTAKMVICFVVNTPSETRILNLYPRRRAFYQPSKM